MLVAKMDLLLKHLHERAEFKEHRKNYVQAMIEHHIGAIGLYKSIDTFSSKYNGDVISSSKHRF